MKLVSFVVDNWPLILGLASLAGSGIAIVVARHYPPSARLKYTVHRQRLLGYPGQDLPDDVSVRFQNYEIERLDKYIFRVWNAGGRELRKDDTIKEAQLKATVPYSRLLGVRLLRRTNPTSGVVVVPGFEFLDEIKDPDDANAAIIWFDHLNKGDGSVFEMLVEHTDGAEHLDNPDPVISGRFRGVMGDPIDVRAERFRRLFVEKETLPFALLILVLMFCVALLPFVEFKEHLSYLILVTIPPLLSMFVGLFLLDRLRPGYPKSLKLDE